MHSIEADHDEKLRRFLKKSYALLESSNTIGLRHGSNERYTLGVSSGAAKPRRSIHRKAAYAISEPCLTHTALFAFGRAEDFL